jgi:hypothetical protein
MFLVPHYLTLLPLDSHYQLHQQHLLLQELSHEAIEKISNIAGIAAAKRSYAVRL